MHSKIFLVIIASDPAHGGVFCELHLSLLCLKNLTCEKKPTLPEGLFLTFPKSLYFVNKHSTNYVVVLRNGGIWITKQLRLKETYCIVLLLPRDQDVSCKVTKGSFNDFYFFKKQYGNCAMKKNECNTQNRRLLPENNATCVTALTLVFKKFSRLK